MTAHYAFNTQPGTFYHTVDTEGFDKIPGTGWLKTTAVPNMRGYNNLVKPDQCRHYPSHQPTENRNHDHPALSPPNSGATAEIHKIPVYILKLLTRHATTGREDNIDIFRQIPAV